MAVPPDWLANLANEIALRMHPVDPLAPIGCHYALHEGCWEITLFVSTTEVVGGEYDGEQFASAYQLDLTGIDTLFTSVSSLGWQPIDLGEEDDLGSHVAIEGICDGHQVWVRVTAVPPRGFGPGRIFSLLDSTVRETW